MKVNQEIKAKRYAFWGKTSDVWELPKIGNVVCPPCRISNSEYSLLKKKNLSSETIG